MLDEVEKLVSISQSESIQDDDCKYVPLLRLDYEFAGLRQLLIHNFTLRQATS
jgi:hypothetical protein